MNNSKKILIFVLAIILVITGYFISSWVKKTQQSISQTAPEKIENAKILNPNDGMVSINFDDGWESVYQKAVPILDAAGMKATFYVITQKHDAEHMTNEQILDLDAKGHEIGSHTRTHMALTLESPQSLAETIFGSRLDLFTLGVKTVDTFAYPYGIKNSKVEKVVQEAGFAGGRGTETGANDQNTNKYKLKCLDVKPSMDFALIQKTIDDAMANRQWQILTFHQIDQPQIKNSDGESVSSDMFGEIVNYLKNNHINVVTSAEALRLLSQRAAN
jgi:peptidoglycan/xylan/chitin deacetylase (PgdA/CDA1 family)